MASTKKRSKYADRADGGAVSTNGADGSNAGAQGGTGGGVDPVTAFELTPGGPAATGNAVSTGAGSVAGNVGAAGSNFGKGWSSVLSGGGNLLGSVFGFGAGGADRNAANNDLQDAYSAFANAKAERQGPSAFNSVQMDPTTRDAQLQALLELKNIYSSGGLDANTRAQLDAGQESNALQARALEGKIQNDMAQRGLAGSGASYAAQEAAAQNAAQNNYRSGMGALALGRQQQMQALAGAGGLASNIRGEDWSQAAQRAAANDAISRFNADNQSRFALERAKGMSAADQAKAQQAMGQSIGTQNMYAGAGQGAGSMLGYGLDKWGGGASGAGGTPGGAGAGFNYGDVTPATAFEE